MNKHLQKLTLLLFVIALCGHGSAQVSEGPIVGKIFQITRGSGEIVVQTTRAAGAIQMGTRLYTRIDGKVAIMKATFPMQTVVKCRLERKYRKHLGSVRLGMPVYKYVEGVEDRQKLHQVKSKVVGGIELVYIPGGSFMMGFPNGIGNEDERPRHKVVVNSFWMGKYEITREQYERIMKNNTDSNISKAKHPVERVTWFNAIEFCNKLSKEAELSPAYAIAKGEKDQNYSISNGIMKSAVSIIPNANGFRLPYEAEWEFACRAGTTTRYYWGNKIDGNYCWYEGNSNKKTHPVGEKRPNRYGLHDMSGNMWEWCYDWYSYNYYKDTPSNNPIGPDNGMSHVYRGGSYMDNENILSSATRRGRMTVFYYLNNVGFRVVLPESAE